MLSATDPLFFKEKGENHKDCFYSRSFGAVKLCTSLNQCSADLTISKIVKQSSSSGKRIYSEKKEKEGGNKKETERKKMKREEIVGRVYKRRK